MRGEWVAAEELAPLLASLDSPSKPTETRPVAVHHFNGEGVARLNMPRGTFDSGKPLTVEAPDQRTRHDEAARRQFRVVEDAGEAIEDTIGKGDDVTTRRRSDVDADGFHELRVMKNQEFRIKNDLILNSESLG